MVTNRTIDRVIAVLKRLVPQWTVPIVTQYKADPFETLISCLLSLRTRDETTAAASERLFKLARGPKQLAALPIPTIEKAIYPVSFYRNKARTVKAVAQTLLDEHRGKVPDELDVLLSLKGVGRKTANLVITLAFRKDGICVDTHVHRISNRWGYIRTKTPEESEFALRKVLPRRHWQIYNDLLVTFGQQMCQPVSPWCSKCPFADGTCARIGVTHSR